MKQIKVVILSLFVFYALLQIIAFMIPNNIVISRALDIKAKKIAILQQLDSFQKWKNWNLGFAGNKNIIYSNDGNEASFENLFLKFVNKSDSMLQYQVQQNSQPIDAHIKIFEHDSISTVQWQYNLKLKWYPWQKFKGVFADNLYGTQLDSNLTALKKIVEN